MANAYSLNQTTQAETGEFNDLFAFDITIRNEAFLNKATIENNLLVKGRIKTDEVEIGQWVNDEFVPYDPPRLVSELFEEISNLQADLDALELRVADLESDVDSLESTVYFTLIPQVNSNTSRIAALEAAP